jgi:hypothetical protein
MFDIICTIAIMVYSDTVGIQQSKDVEGKLLYESQYKYVVDFSQGVKKYNVPSTFDYSKVLVNKDQCVREK